MIVLFDANVLISGLTASQLCQEIIAIVLREHEPLTSPAIQAEAERSIRKKFSQHQAALAALKEYARFATLVDPPPLANPVCRDRDDDWVLSAAIAGEADAIVTGDQDLLILKQHQSIPILTPRQFLELLADPTS